MTNLPFKALKSQAFRIRETSSVPRKLRIQISGSQSSGLQCFTSIRFLMFVMFFMTPTIQILLSLFHNCNCATIINVNVIQISNIQDIRYSTPVKRSISPHGGGDAQAWDSQVESH